MSLTTTNSLRLNNVTWESIRRTLLREATNPNRQIHINNRELSQSKPDSVSVHDVRMPIKVMRLPRSTRLTETAVSSIKNKSPKNHLKYVSFPGAPQRKALSPPTKLLQAALVVLEKYPIKKLSEHVSQLQRYLWSRQIPPESTEVRKRGREIEHQLASLKLQQTDVEGLTPEQIEQHMVEIRKQMVLRMRQETYHWKEMDMGAYLSIVYLSSHLLSNYSTLYSIISEIAAIDPEFKPVSMLDFGSGLATNVWVVNEIWDTVKEHYCWDRSVDVCTLARLLLQEGQDNADMIYPGVYFRQQFEQRDAKQSAGFDLVVSAYTLFELPDQKTRLSYIDRLWTQTNNYLILAENGTLHGQRLIEEARMHIITTYGDDKEKKGYVFAPCPHDEVCPKLASNSRSPCNFETVYKIKNKSAAGLFYEKESKKSTSGRNGTTVRYSYVVMKKGEVREERTPRTLNNPVIRSRSCIQCQMCFPDGQARFAQFCTPDVSKEVFGVAKHSILGTRMPICGWQDGDNNISDNTTLSDKSTVLHEHNESSMCEEETTQN